jgi:MFS family permease
MSQVNAVQRFAFVHEIDEYPRGARRWRYLGLSVAATIGLYYAYYVQTGVTPQILQSYHMSFSYYVGIVIVSNLIGAFASLPAGKTDKLGRANVVIYGLLLVAAIMAFGVPAAHSEFTFALVICILGFVEGAILVATPALVRDYSPQMGRAVAMGFWTIGPVAGSLVVSVVAANTLPTSGANWQGQFITAGWACLGLFVLSLLFLKDLSPRLRDQIMVSSRDRDLLEAKARGLSASEVEAATRSPWKQIFKPDLFRSAFGISLFLLIYFVASGFFTIYYAVSFKNPDGTVFTTTQANHLNQWWWGANCIGLIVAGVISDKLRVRKPLMLLGTLGSMGMMVLFLSKASNPHTSFNSLALIGVLFASTISLAYAPWMAGYTEEVEAKNPALVATGLSLWGWVIRMVVGISFFFMPMVITSVSPVVDNLPYVNHLVLVKGQKMTVADFAVKHADSVAFARKHQALLNKVSALPTWVQSGLQTLDGKSLAYASKQLGPTDFAALVSLAGPFKQLVVPYAAALTYLSANQSHLNTALDAVAKSPAQWQRWFWIDFAGMVAFIPLIFMMKGRWSPKKAAADLAAHEARLAALLS